MTSISQRTKMSAIGNLSLNMSSNYNEHGVDEYYKKVAASYRNPHFPGVKKVVFELLNRWWIHEGAGVEELQVLDMAAGSGEATICIQDWYSSGRALHDGRSVPAIANSLPTSANGPALSSSAHPLAALGAAISNSRPAFIPPSHQPVIPNRKPPTSAAKLTIGQTISQPVKLQPTFKEINITATDPYTSPAYKDRTGGDCLPMSFQDLANGQLPAQPAHYNFIICSFALHLVPSPSELFSLLYALSERADWLVIIAPHKKPEIKETWGWARWDFASWSAVGEAGLYAGGRSIDDDEAEKESDIVLVREKVKCRLYRSLASM